MADRGENFRCASRCRSPGHWTTVWNRSRGRDEAKAEVVRGALRAFLDEHADVIGSRKPFTKAFGRRVDHVE